MSGHRARTAAVPFLLFALLFGAEATARPNASAVWTPNTSSPPAHVVIGGRENGRALAVCRARFRGGVHPGKVVAGMCNIGWGGREYTIRPYEVLSGRGLGWVASAKGRRVVVGGYEPGRKLLICRARLRGAWHPGKVVAGKCNIGWGGAEHTIPTYQVLVHTRSPGNSSPTQPQNPPPPGPRTTPRTTPHTNARWQTARGSIPRGALRVRATQPAYLCRVRVGDDTIPGTTTGRVCVIAFHGERMSVDNFDVLLGARGQWRAATTASRGVLRAGKRAQVCRARVAGALHAGAVVRGGCLVVGTTRPVTSRMFEVFVMGR